MRAYPAQKEADAIAKEAIRSLKRRLSDTIYRAMLADTKAHNSIELHVA